ncbi:hypothetical protein GCM10012289_15840 [Nonomuraea cavernae]|uniref:Uncharacterized protein n=1 Tax=Nonomuraea cavernae TaxID=2045107 RepID=A0A918DHW5_9ACTN|nr:hypothetical protein GCM10012289_15840 [Nonomuraea cavernae]
MVMTEVPSLYELSDESTDLIDTARGYFLLSRYLGWQEADGVFGLLDAKKRLAGPVRDRQAPVELGGP